LITIDTLRADHLGAYGNPRAVSPFLDRLSARGTLHGNCLATVPATTPSHATILTGLSSFHHGSRFNAVPIRASIDPLASRLHRAGYGTAAFISAFPVYSTVSDLDRGFSCYNQFLAPDRGPQLLYLSSLVRPFSRIGVLRPAERKANMTAAHAEAWLRQVSSPFFVWCHFYDPHLPYDPPQPFDRMFNPDGRPGPVLGISEVQRIDRGEMTPETVDQAAAAAMYDGEIAFTDRMVERVVSTALDVRGDAELFVVVTADHGESLTEHGYYYSHSRLLYQPSLHVPLLMVRLPGDGPGRVVNRTCGLMDVAVTVLAECGLDWSGLDGQALPATRDSGSPPPLIGESAEGVFTTAHKPSLDALQEKRYCVVSDAWKYIRNPDGGEELYDLDSDPGELDDVAAGNHSVVTGLAAELAAVEMGFDMDAVTPPTEEELVRLRELGYVNAD
ncbi:sulfatase, partial [bacterium]|nr:sulfatase [candidate division CSSED10-310 bacterium]